jgi:hypothetical protein
MRDGALQYYAANNDLKSVRLVLVVRATLLFRTARRNYIASHAIQDIISEPVQNLNAAKLSAIHNHVAVFRFILAANLPGVLMHAPALGPDEGLLALYLPWQYNAYATGRFIMHHPAFQAADVSAAIHYIDTEPYYDYQNKHHGKGMPMLRLLANQPFDLQDRSISAWSLPKVWFLSRLAACNPQTMYEPERWFRDKKITWLLRSLY